MYSLSTYIHTHTKIGLKINEQSELKLSRWNISLFSVPWQAMQCTQQAFYESVKSPAQQRCKGQNDLYFTLFWHICTVYSQQFRHVVWGQEEFRNGHQQWNRRLALTNSKYNLRHPYPYNSALRVVGWIQRHIRQRDRHRIIEIHMYKEAGTSSSCFPGVVRGCLQSEAETTGTLPG